MHTYTVNPHTVTATQVPHVGASIEDFTLFIGDLQRMFKKTVFDWTISDSNYVSIRCFNASGINTAIGPGGWIVKSGVHGEKLTAVGEGKFRKDYTLQGGKDHDSIRKI